MIGSAAIPFVPVSLVGIITPPFYYRKWRREPLG
jgi:hypothetical protein